MCFDHAKIFTQDTWRSFVLCDSILWARVRKVSLGIVSHANSLDTFCKC